MKQKVKDDKESEELKKYLKIIPDDGDDITIDAISLSSNKMLKIFNREDLEVFWRLVKARFEKVPVAPEVGAAAVALPAGVLELDTHSSSEADPSESSLPSVSISPTLLPFLFLDDSKSDTEIPEMHVSPTPHDAMLTRWINRVASRSSSPTTFILEIPTAPILPAPYAIVSPSSEEDIPIGRPYRTHPDRPCKALTTRKSVRPLPSHRLVLRHTPPNTIDVDSSTPPRFVHPPLARTLRCSEAYLRWRSALLSTMYPPTTFELSTGDSSFESSAGPSRKRCRSLAATMTSSIHDSVEEDVDTDVLEDIEVDATVIGVEVDRDVKAGIDVGIGMEVDVGIDVEDEIKDEVESIDRGTMEVGLDVVARIDIPEGM
nr:hypothetical protein [Tanacetum cinerariifolium]